MSDSDIVVGGVVGGVAGAILGGKVGYDQGYQNGYVAGQRAGYDQGYSGRDRELQPVIEDLRKQLESERTGKTKVGILQLIKRALR